MSAEATINERLAAITAAGTSVWLDQIRRSMTENGELARLVAEESLHGVTSNPAIFEKTILGSNDYDETVAQLAREGKTGREIYRAIAVRDVQEAADVLRTVYDATGGRDGYVSLEVAPRLAHDTEGTIEQARSYWELLDRPNVMIKIPGTDEGLPAIEQMIYEGRNINVTLLFAVSQYVKVCEAFIAGLERRDAEGLSLDVHSVASFFVSRVDSEVDKRLEKLGRSDLAGKAGLANARAAYATFTEIFGGERFAALRAAGAPVQRPLWASTGVKNPAYPDTLYVDGLIAPDTVNTMPMATLQAAAQRGVVTGATAALDATADLKALADAGIDIEDVTTTLLHEGIEAFIKPMGKLLAGIESKREGILTSRPAAIESSIPDGLETTIARRVAQATADDVARRIWRKDDTLWGAHGAPEVSNRLGWLTIGGVMADQLGDLRSLANDVAGEGITDVVLLGMGGSSLAPEVLRRSFGNQGGHPTLHVLDSTDTEAIAAVQSAIDLDHTLFIVSSKSGGTLETLSHFAHFHSLVRDGQRFVAVTDPGSPLADLATEHGFRRTFLNDPDIGGRYSALSFFGLVPAALMGADIEGLLHMANVAEHACQAFDAPQQNTGLWLGCALGELALAGRDKLTFIVSEPIASFGLWVEQLVAESTGKQGRGILPVADEPFGDPSSYGDDRTFVYLRYEPDPDPQLEAQAQALAQSGQPVITMAVQGPADLGNLFFTSEFAVAVIGWVLEINPFDQPNVAEAKEATNRVLADGAAGGTASDATDDDLRALLGSAEPPSYVAIMGYVAPSAAFDEAVAELRSTIRDATKATTTFGYGPRFLHSTGQLHKGGPKTGRFLQLIHDGIEDIEIPGKPYTFTTLKHAQADGDLNTLRAHELAAVRVTLTGGDGAAALRALTERTRDLLPERD